MGVGLFLCPKLRVCQTPQKGAWQMRVLFMILRERGPPLFPNDDHDDDDDRNVLKRNHRHDRHHRH